MKIKEKIKQKQFKIKEKKIEALENRVENLFLNTVQKPIASLFSKYFLNEKTTYKLYKIAEMENNLDRNDLIYKTDNVKKDKI